MFRESNPGWESVVPHLINTLGKKKKKKKVSEESSDIKSEDKSEESEDELPTDSEEEIDDDSEDDRDKEDINAVSGESEEEGDESQFVASLKAAIGKSPENKVVKSKTKPSKPKFKDTESGEGVVKMLDLTSDNNDWSNQVSAVETKSTAASKRSSFFMGGESESEEENVESDESDDNDDNDVDTRIENLRTKNFHSQSNSYKSGSQVDSKCQNYKRDQNFGKRKQFQKDTSAKKPKFNKNTDRTQFQSRGAWDKNKPQKKPFQNSPRDSSHNAAPDTKPSVNNTNINNDSKVHPSWQAKQKQKPSIQTFQGKKIVFE